MNDPEVFRDDPWRWLNWSIVLVLVGAVIMIVLISSGLFDPKPIGELVRSESLAPLDIREEGQRLIWLDIPAPGTDYSLRLSAALAEGEEDSAYGLALGADREFLVAAFSPVGYVSFWQQGEAHLDRIIPWRTWPRVRLGSETNELWLDIEGGHLTSIRTNRELLWQGRQPLAGNRIGLWAETFAGPVSFDFQRLEVFARPFG